MLADLSDSFSSQSGRVLSGFRQKEVKEVLKTLCQQPRAFFFATGPFCPLSSSVRVRLPDDTSGQPKPHFGGLSICSSNPQNGLETAAL